MVQSIHNADLLTQQYMSSVGAIDGINASFMGTDFNPYNSIFNGGLLYNTANVKQMTNYNCEVADSNVKVAQKNSAANSLLNSPEQAVERRMGILQRQIMSNRRNNIKEEYTKLCDEVRAMYEKAGFEDVPDSEIRAHIDSIYYQRTQSRIVDDIEKNCTNPFVQGVIQGTGVGCMVTDSTSRDEIISMITDEKQSIGSKAAQTVGNAVGVVGALCSVLALPLVLKIGGKGVGKLAKTYMNLLGFAKNKA